MLIVADDLTGAADCAVAATATGLSACVSLGGTQEFSGADVLSIDAGTRRMTAERAAAETARIFQAFSRTAFPIVYKKLDSTLKGNIGAELAAARKARPGSLIVMAPAFPATGRTTIGGTQRVHGEPVGNLRQILEAAGLRTKSSGVDQVRAGALSDCRDEFDAMVCDAAEDRDLRAIAEQILALEIPVIWAGSAGLARHLPPAAGLARPPRAAVRLPVVEKPVLFAVGSASKRSLEQAEALRASGSIAVETLAAGISGGPSIGLADDLLAMIGNGAHGGGAENPGLCTALASALAPHAGRFGALVLTGGETARAVLDVFGVTALRIVREMEPGVPLSLSAGPVELPVITKAGGFGDRDTLVRCRRALARKR